MSSNLQRLRRNADPATGLSDIPDDPDLQDDLDDCPRDLQQGQSGPHDPQQQTTAGEAAVAALAAVRRADAVARDHTPTPGVQQAARRGAAAAGQPRAAPGRQPAQAAAAGRSLPPAVQSAAAGDVAARTGGLTAYGRASKNASAQEGRLGDSIVRGVAQIGDMFAPLAAQGDKHVINNGQAVAAFLLQLPIKDRPPLILTLTEGSMVSEASTTAITDSLIACAKLAMSDVHQQKVSMSGALMTAYMTMEHWACQAQPLH